MSASASSDRLNFSWWSCGGWEWKPAPEAFERAETSVDWVRGLREAGYSRDCDTRECTALPYEIWSHRDGHLLVSVAEVGFIFVEARDAMPFWVECFPKIEVLSLAERRVEAAEVQSRSLLGWVRHGHGVDTIDAHGTETKDDAHFRREVERSACGTRRSAA